VYTPCDSLVFGGNYLHSYAIRMQLKGAPRAILFFPFLEHKTLQTQNVHRKEWREVLDAPTSTIMPV
jgi:hypothetical protein